jgi:nucleoside-diphosphate-sugar epimerase
VKLCVLGGTAFLGRALVDAALARGHEVTLFNRGKTNPELFPDLECLVGDRAGDLAPIRGRTFDAVVDTSGYLPRDVAAACDALAEAGRYCFVSSVSAYADLSVPVDEESPLALLGELPAGAVTGESYGPLKALCEQVVVEAFAERALVVRPGLIAGPHDPTGRFTYWPHRVARGGEVLAPAPAEGRIQAIDARDLGSWIVALCEREASGVYNATHPGFTWADLLGACAEVVQAASRTAWVPSEFLVEQEVGEWMELPLWIASPAFAGVHHVDVGRALAAGLALRPLAETVRGALEDAETSDGVGLTPERERKLLTEWHGRR